MKLESVTIEQPIKASPARVWERISTPEGIARWWAPGNIAAVLGHEFTLDMGAWGNVACRVIDLVPGEKLAYTFADFELHWTILPEADGCILRLDHKGFDLSKPQHRHAFENMGPGWRTTVLPRLAESFLAEAA
jgi:uncharacterized protein YndB with AHSA1/START domain